MPAGQSALLCLWVTGKAHPAPRVGHDTVLKGNENIGLKVQRVLL